jgi:hypothetical protein
MTMTVNQKPMATRLAKVIRLNFLNPWPYLITPWIIIAILMSATYLLEVSGIAGLSADGVVLFRPVYFLVIYLFVIANQTLYHQYPLALSYGITRKDFYLGTLISAVITSLVFAVGGTVIAVLMGDVSLADPAQLSQEVLYTFESLLSIQILAIALTSLYLRWGAKGVGGFFLIVAATITVLPFLIARVGTFDEFWDWLFADHPSLTNGIAPLAFLLAAGLAGYWLIRRSSPRTR